MPSPPVRRRTRSNGAGKFTAVEDFARYSVEAVQEAAAAGKEGGQGPPLPGRRGTRGSGVRKSTAAEDLAPLLTGMLQRRTRSKGGRVKTHCGGGCRSVTRRGHRKNRSIRGFRYLPFMISGWAMIRLSCHCRRVYRYTSMRICIFHKLSVCGNASG